jgi:hypothetical protein
MDLFESEPQDSAAFTRQFAFYRLMRRQQTGHPLYATLAAPRNRILRRTLNAPLYAIELARAFKLRAGLADPELGNALFVHLSKVQRMFDLPPGPLPQVNLTAVSIGTLSK